MVDGRSPANQHIGSHPSSAQMPPSGRESTTATRQPAARTRIEATIAAVPSADHEEIVWIGHGRSSGGRTLESVAAAADSRGLYRRTRHGSI